MFIGLLFIGSLVLASFSYTSIEERDGNKKRAMKDGEKTFVMDEKIEEEPPPPDEPPAVDVPPPPQEDIVEEENTEEEPEVVVAIAPPVKRAPVQKVTVEIPIIDFPDVEAQFPGGCSRNAKVDQRKCSIPQTAIEMEDQGKVYLAFVVEPDGDISNIVIQRGVSKELDREAKRVVKSMPKWIPGEAGGKKARTRCRLPINFTLN